MRHASHALTLLVVLQVASAWAAPGRVLCITDSDHVAQESLESACCRPGDPVARADARVLVHLAAEDCCGPCIDIPLVATAPAVSNGEQVDLAPPSSSTAPWIARLVGPAARATACFRRAPAPPRLALLALRTVVLTC